MKLPNKSIDFAEIKRIASGRWPEIIAALTPLTGEVFTKGRDDHPCPNCSSDSTIWPAKNATETGSIACRNCTGDKPTGDGFATVAAFAGITQVDAAKLVAGYLGIGGESSETPQRDIIAEVCKEKRMPIDAFKKFEPEIVKRGRGKQDCARVPVYDETGNNHSHFDFVPGHKGFNARGKGMSGMFFPGRLPQAGETWHIVEGCKDAAALVGLGLNAAGLPTSYMTDKFAGLFRGVDVVLVPDLDEVGQNGAQRSGGNLKGIAASIHVVRLPGEITKTKGDDVRDVLARTDGEKLVREAIAAAEPWQPRDGEHDPKDGRPEVRVTLAYGWAVDQVTGHLGRLGWASPWIPAPKRDRLKLYHRGGALVHVVVEDDAAPLPGHVTTAPGTARIRPLPAGQLPLRIADACQLIAEKESSEGIETIAIPPPRWLVDGIYTRGDYSGDVPRLEAIITAPTLRADGSIVQRHGYDERTGLLFQSSTKFPPVADKPTQADAKAAGDELLGIVQDFPLVGDADRSAWLALVLSQIGRPAVSGCVPLFAITANVRGSGKSLLADSASLIAFGRPAARKTYSTDDNETRKAITATALEALPSVLLDNLDVQLGGASLDAALTATTWSDRVLGTSTTTGDLPLRTVWSATGNNLSFGSDIARRVLPIRLASPLENPEERDDIEQADLLGYVAKNRPRYAVAALTILRAYFLAGCPSQAGGTFGSFESWSHVVRGAIVWAGFADPLTTRETAKADDQSGAVVRGLIGGLLEIDEHNEGMTAREIVKELKSEANADRFLTMREVAAEVATYKGVLDTRRLGNELKKYRDRVANGFRIEAKPGRGGVMKWLATSVNGWSGGSGGSVSSASAVKTCVSPDTHTGDTHDPYGDGAGIDQPDQPDQPNTPTTIPCPRCGAKLVRLADTPIVGGWVNLDCPTPNCGHVKAVKAEAAEVTR